MLAVVRFHSIRKRLNSDWRYDMKYFVECYSGRSGHKTWGVYRNHPNVGVSLVCVCVYRKGAVEVCDELNTLVLLKGVVK